MKPELTRITLDLPKSMHSKIKTQATHKGETIRQFFMELIENVQPLSTIEHSAKSTPNKPFRIRPTGLKLNITEAELKQKIDDIWQPKF
jgi:hypothetical protein